MQKTGEKQKLKKRIGTVPTYLGITHVLGIPIIVHTHGIIIGRHSCLLLMSQIPSHARRGEHLIRLHSLLTGVARLLPSKLGIKLLRLRLSGVELPGGHGVGRLHGLPGGRVLGRLEVPAHGGVLLPRAAQHSAHLAAGHVQIGAIHFGF